MGSAASMPWASPKTDNQYHAGWAWAGSAPYKGTKLLASHFGGTRNPMAVRWPGKDCAGCDAHDRSSTTATMSSRRFTKILGITPPRVVNGFPQDPIDGVSFAYTFDDPKAKGRLLTQYFEIMGSRSVYHDGWIASAFGPRIPVGCRTAARLRAVDAGQGYLGGLYKSSKKTGLRLTTLPRRSPRSSLR